MPTSNARGRAQRLLWVMFSCLMIMESSVPLRTALSDEPRDQTRVYVTRADRRDAATGYEVYDWLTIGLVADLEYSHIASNQEFSKSFSAGLQLDFNDWISGEILYEYDGDANDQEIDEATIQIASSLFDVEFGRFYLPFGAFHSRFASGPILEFGETRADAIEVSHDGENGFEASIFIYRGDARVDSGRVSHLDWGCSATYAVGSHILLGASYISDLADSGERLLADVGNRHRHRVGGVSAYWVLGFDSFEITYEFVRSVGSFSELDPDLDQPRAWNLELSLPISEDLELALRREESSNVDESFRHQSGTALSWRVGDGQSVTFEYLYGEAPQEHQHVFGAQLTIEL